jgi:glycosyltransferase involved in cell wall biosynthesis
MRILQAFDFLSTTYGGGTVNILYQLTKTLQARGHDVTICTSNDRIDNCDFKVKAYRSWLNLPGIRVTPGIINFKINDYDIIHFHSYRSIQNAFLYYKAIKHNVPYVIDAHGSTIDLNGSKQYLRSLFDSFIGYKALKNADVLISETEIGVKEYQKLGVIKNIQLLHPLFDISEFTDLPVKGLFRSKYQIKERIVLFIGRIHKLKGIDVLAKAVKRLDDVKLVVVGQDDGFKSELDKLIKELGINVLFTGYLSGKDKLSALVDTDILVQPSLNEAGARPSMESILCDTPVIVTKENGAGKEIALIDGGYLVEYGMVEKLSETIKYVLDNYAEAKNKTIKAKSYIKENLSLDKQIIEYENIYKKAIEFRKNML